MVRVGVPSVTCVIGEGGSGGAVAIAVADRVLMRRRTHLLRDLAGRAAPRFSGATPRRRRRGLGFRLDAAHCLGPRRDRGHRPGAPGAAPDRHRIRRACSSAVRRSHFAVRSSTAASRPISAPAARSSARWACSPSPSAVRLFRPRAPVHNHPAAAASLLRDATERSTMTSARRTGLTFEAPGPRVVRAGSRSLSGRC